VAVWIGPDDQQKRLPLASSPPLHAVLLENATETIPEPPTGRGDSDNAEQADHRLPTASPARARDRTPVRYRTTSSGRRLARHRIRTHF
jgi:hypothetical protein